MPTIGLGGSGAEGILIPSLHKVLLVTAKNPIYHNNKMNNLFNQSDVSKKVTRIERVTSGSQR